MITAYYTETEKYLQKGSYRKDFNVDNIADLISNIKVKEPILIKARAKDIFAFKFTLEFSENSDSEIEYEILDENENNVNIEPIFDYTFVEYDRDSRDIAYAYYDIVNSKKWRDILGERICFCRNRELQLYLAREKKEGVFLYDDLEKLKNGLLKEGRIPYELVIKMHFTDEEIERENLLDKKTSDNVK